jgi:hypothetical protein
LLAIALAGGACGPALAQQFGTYQGTTSQGNAISISIGNDGSGGFVYTGNGVGWSMTCKTGDTKNANWGIGASQPFTGKKVTAYVKFDILYEKLTMTFNGAGDVVSGTFTGGEPAYVDVQTSTKKVESCLSEVQTYTATYVPGSAPTTRPAAPGSATRFSTQ